MARSDQKRQEGGRVALTEGVDVPAVDVVAFLSPRKSKVDIVQAAGRAMRKSDGTGKKYGYLLLPLFLETEAGESVEDALERTRFNEAWDVLQAMQEQDAELADIIEEMRVERGRTGVFDDSRLREKFEVLGPQVSLAALKQGVSTSIVERLGNNWDERYGELIKYKEEHGDCDVPQNSSTRKSLGIWVARQRRSYDRGELPKDRIDRLEALGFAWDVLSKIWEARFSELCRYKSKHGDCNVPRHWKENRHLGYWVNTQRIDYKEGILPEDKVKRLEAVGFHWSPSRDRWEKMFLELAEYQKIHGTCIVPRKLTGNSELANWVGTQRRKRRMGSLPSHLVSRLDDLGFAWDRFEEAWEAKFQQLKAYKSMNGNCNVPIEHPEHSSLGSWVSDQRKRFNQGKVSEKRRKKLCSIGFLF